MPKKPSPSPKWGPAPEALVRTFEAALAGFPEARVRKMFGYPAAFVRGHMFAGLFQDSMILRLSAEDRAEFSGRLGAGPFEPMPGRAMREYLTVPSATLAAPAELERWVGKAFAYAGSLPPKAGEAAPPPPKRKPKR